MESFAFASETMAVVVPMVTKVVEEAEALETFPCLPMVWRPSRPPCRMWWCCHGKWDAVDAADGIKSACPSSQPIVAQRTCAYRARQCRQVSHPR